MSPVQVKTVSGKAASTGLCAGREVTRVPTATQSEHFSTWPQPDARRSRKPAFRMSREVALPRPERNVRPMSAISAPEWICSL